MHYQVATPEKLTTKQFIARAIAMTALIIATIFLGLRFGSWLKAKNFQGPSVTLGVAFIVATIKDAIPQMQKLREYLTKGTSEHLFGISGFIFLLAVSIVTASVLPNTPAQLTQQPPVIFLNENASSAPPPDPPAPNFKPTGVKITSVPFFQEADDCTAPDFGDGTKLDPSTDSFIAQLSKGFLHCSEQGKSVAVKVYGFASSKAFKESECGEKSPVLNLRLANKRADVVASEFTKVSDQLKQKDTSLANRQVSFTAYPWNTSTEMENARAFNDKGPDGKADKDRGDLTRRADLWVEDPGGCRLFAQGKK